MSKNKKVNKENMLLLMQTAFPPLFDRENPKPLEIGILQKFFEALPQVQRWKIRRFIAWWCNRQAYLRAVAKKGSKRYGIDGEFVSAVKKGDREHAQGLVDAELKRRAERVRPKREAVDK